MGSPLHSLSLPAIAPPVFHGTATHLLKGHGVISWGIHLLAGRAATEVRQRGPAGQGSALTKCANKGPLCAQPLSSSNCPALRKNTSARLPEGTTPSLYSQRGNLGRGHHPTKVLRNPLPHNGGLVVATHSLALEPTLPLSGIWPRFGRGKFLRLGSLTSEMGTS